MFWVFCLVQVEGFWQCIFNPYPWFTKSKHSCVVSYKLGNIMFDDAPFCFQNSLQILKHNQQDTICWSDFAPSPKML